MFRVLRPSSLLILCGVASSFTATVFCRAQASGAAGTASFTSPGLTSQPGASSSIEPTLKGSILAKPEAAVTDLLAAASALYGHGKLTAAEEKYRLILLANPASAPARAGLARIYLKQGEVTKASEMVSKGLALSNSADLHVALGEVYFRQGRIPEAEVEWRSVVNSGNLNARAYLGLARVRRALSLHKVGRQMLEKARSLNSADPDIEMDWSKSLPLSERIARLESYMSNDGAAPADKRSEAQRYLDYLRLLNRPPEGNCHLVMRPSVTELPLEPLRIDSEHLRGYGLNVALNGRRTTLMLDTGATGIIISQKAAQRAGIARGAETAISGLGDGGRSGYYGVAKSIRIGDLEFENCVIRVLDKSVVVEDAGLIGTDVFEDFLVNIDFPRAKLRLAGLPPTLDEEARPDFEDRSAARGDARAFASPDPRSFALTLEDPSDWPGMHSYTRVYRFGHCLLVPTRIGSAQQKLFLLDTGAFQSQITPAAAREVTKLHKDSATRVIGINGSIREVFIAEAVSLEFGGVHQEGRDLVAFDLSSSSTAIGTEISGTLGFTMLRHLNVGIDYRDGMVAFDVPHP